MSTLEKIQLLEKLDIFLKEVICIEKSGTKVVDINVVKTKIAEIKFML